MLRLPLCLVCVPHGSQCVVSRSGVPRDFHLPTRVLVRVLVPQPERIARRQLPAIFLSRRVKVILPVELRQALVFVDLVPSPSCGRSCPKIRFFFAVRADFFFFWSPRQGPAGISFCSPALISALRIGISLKHAARSRFRLIYFATRTGALCSATVSALVLLASRATVSVRRFARPAPSRVICSFVSSFPVACVRSCPLRPRDSCCAANFRCRLNVVSLFFGCSV
jgi:hypothetical protein